MTTAPTADAWVRDRMRFALLEYGFRPFFLLAGAYGASAILAWVCIYTGLLQLPLSWPETLWHGHEMVFGFAVAGLAGFMLTAVPSWTGDAPNRRGKLLLLALLWIAGRVALWECAALPAALVAAVDLAFLPALAALLSRSLVDQIPKAGLHNVAFLGVLGMIWTGNLLTHLDALGLVPGAAPTGLHLGIDTLLLAITLVGGRIVPNFTANALRNAGALRLPRSFRPLELATVVAMLGFLVCDVALGASPASGIAALTAAAASGARLALWRPLATARTPLLWILHVGYAWLVAGLILSGIAGLSDGGIIPASAALHALTAGAIGTMLLAVMSRAALGHTGRPLVAPPLVVGAYGLVTAGATLRVIAPLAGSATLVLLAASGILWALAMALFTAVYAPILIRPRIDGKPG